MGSRGWTADRSRAYRRRIDLQLPFPIAVSPIVLFVTPRPSGHGLVTLQRRPPSLLEKPPRVCGVSSPHSTPSRPGSQRVEEIKDRERRVAAFCLPVNVHSSVSRFVTVACSHVSAHCITPPHSILIPYCTNDCISIIDMYCLYFSVSNQSVFTKVFNGA